MPIKLIDIARSALQVPAAYQHKLLICRDDQHIAWRADELPDASVRPLLDRLTGRATTSQAANAFAAAELAPA